MNPTLTRWLDEYMTAAADYAEETRYLHVDQLMPGRPPQVQFTITSTGLLRDHAGARIAHITELNPAALRTIGVDRTRLTARQRRTPMPRRNPDTTRLTAELRAAHDAEVALHTTTPAEPGTEHAMRGIDASRLVIIDEAATLQAPPTEAELTAALGTPVVSGLSLPDTEAIVAALNAANPWTPPEPVTMTRTWREDAIPDDAAPGDVVTDGDNRRVGIVGRNGRNEVVVVRDPNPLHDRLRRGLVVPNPAEDLSRLTIAPGPDLMARVSDGMAAASASVAAMNASVSAAMDLTPAPGFPPEVHEGPRMLGTLSYETGAAERYTSHTRTTEVALERASRTFHARGLYGSTARRMGEESTRASYVDRSAVQVGMFMNRAYGIEFNDETLTAVAAMTTVFARQASMAATRRAETAEATAAAERECRDALTVERDTLRTAAAVISTVDPGPVEAAAAAARAWKEAPVSDSVAKLASFKTLLAALDRLAQ